MYEENCLPREIFAAGLRNSHRDIQNWKTDRPCHPFEVVTGVAVSQLEVMVRVDRWARISKVVDTVGCSQELPYSKVDDWLHFEKWVVGGFPENWILEHKMTLTGLALKCLCRYEAGEGDVLGMTISRDESWVHQFQPVSKQASMRWKHAGSPVATMCRDLPPEAKVVRPFFGLFISQLIATQPGPRLEKRSLPWSTEGMSCLQTFFQRW